MLGRATAEPDQPRVHPRREAFACARRRVAPQTPRALAPGALFLQPGEERRRSGSHYTPRELTEPIVRTTLRPVLEALGPRPTPEQILDLKVCDPAMGSGAFLVEACRQLGEALVAAWEVHGSTPKLPADEDVRLHARRLVAQRCLYGVDKNRFAVNLAKLSLWLATLAKDHAFTFLDHALKHGDSLVGLTKAQIGAFHWSPPERDFGPLFAGVTHTVDEVSAWRREIQKLDEGDYDRRRMAWKEAEDVVHDVRLIGDLCLAAYFGAEKDRDREALRLEYRRRVDAWKGGGDRTQLEVWVDELRTGERAVVPLHWEIEFPEVFGRENPGFDAMVGNPPFAGKNLQPVEKGRSVPLAGREVDDISVVGVRRTRVDGEMTEKEARRWPDLMAIVEANVKPERDRNNRETYRRNWWHFGEKRVELVRAIAGLERVLLVTRHQHHWTVGALAPTAVFAESMIVFPLPTQAAFAALQSRPHEIWARFFGSTLGDGLRYTPSDCFETFPFPPNWQTDPTLETVGQTYYEFRAALMVRNDEGLTKTYNRFGPDPIRWTG